MKKIVRNLYDISIYLYNYSILYNWLTSFRDNQVLSDGFIDFTTLFIFNAIFLVVFDSAIAYRV